MNCAVLGGDEVIIANQAASREVEGKTTGFDEGHAGLFLLGFSASIDILLVRVGVAFELFEFGQLKSLLHGPLDDSAISGDRDERFALALTLDPMKLPNDLSVSSIEVSALNHRLIGVILNIENRDDTVRVTGGDQIRLLDRELTASDTVVCSDDLLRIVRILQSPGLFLS